MKKTNTVLRRTINKVEEKGRKENVDIWLDVAESLRKANRKKKPVNLAKLDRVTEDGDVIVVPGKVAGYGNLDKKLTVAAFSFSKEAKEQIDDKGKYMSILDLVEENPSGKGVRIIE